MNIYIPSHGLETYKKVKINRLTNEKRNQYDLVCT